MARLVESEMVVFVKESFFLPIPLSLGRALVAGNIGQGLINYFIGWGRSLREWYPLQLGIKYCMSSIRSHYVCYSNTSYVL